MPNAPTATYRLLLVIMKYFGYGGLQRDMMKIAQMCIADGHTVEILTSAWEGDIPNGLMVRHFDCRALTNHGRIKKLEIEFNRMRTDTEYDCTIGFNKIGGLDLYYAGDPCLSAKLNAKRRRFYRLIPRYRSYLQQESRVFGSASNTEILLIAHQEKVKFMEFYGTASDRFHLLPPGIDQVGLTNSKPNMYERNEIRREFGIDDEGFVILQVGSSFRTKGVDRSIKAFASLPERLRKKSVLVIAGKGKSAFYEKLARQLSIADEVRFVGGRDDVNRLYYGSDILLHPARNENTGTVILESMVCGLAVLATANCGYATHVEKADSGLFVVTRKWI